MRVNQEYTNKFAIEPNSHGGWDVYRWEVEKYTYDGALLEKPRERWYYVTSYRNLRQANKYIKHLAQPTQYVEIT